MSRGIAWFDAFRELAPEWVVVVLGLVTQLGDVWFLAALVGALYVFETGNRDEIAAIAGLLLAGLSLITSGRFRSSSTRCTKPLRRRPDTGFRAVTP